MVHNLCHVEEDGQEAQPVKHLPCWGTPITPVLGRERQEDLLGSLACQSSLVGKLQANERHFLKKDGGSLWGWHSKLSLGLHTRIHMHTHVHIHICIKNKKSIISSHNCIIANNTKSIKHVNWGAGGDDSVANYLPREHANKSSDPPYPREKAKHAVTQLQPQC